MTSGLRTCRDGGEVSPYPKQYISYTCNDNYLKNLPAVQHDAFFPSCLWWISLLSNTVLILQACKSPAFSRPSSKLLEIQLQDLSFPLQALYKSGVIQVLFQSTWHISSGVIYEVFTTIFKHYFTKKGRGLRDRSLQKILSLKITLRLLPTVSSLDSYFYTFFSSYKTEQTGFRQAPRSTFPELLF